MGAPAMFDNSHTSGGQPLRKHPIDRGKHTSIDRESDTRSAVRARAAVLRFVWQGWLKDLGYRFEQMVIVILFRMFSNLINSIIRNFYCLDFNWPTLD